jgi:hypothetical protein
MNRSVRPRPIERLALIHSVFYLIMGLWPIFHLASFMAVSGLKNDWWLVRTVGILITCSGAMILMARLRREMNGSVMLLAVSNAAALLAVDLYYVRLKTIGPVYLLDAVVEAALVFAWLILWSRNESIRVS